MAATSAAISGMARRAPATRWRSRGNTLTAPSSSTPIAAAQASGVGAGSANSVRSCHCQRTASGNWTCGAFDSATWPDGVKCSMSPFGTSVKTVRPTATASVAASGWSRWAASSQPFSDETSTGWSPRTESAIRPSGRRPSDAVPASNVLLASRLPQYSRPPRLTGRARPSGYGVIRFHSASTRLARGASGQAGCSAPSCSSVAPS